MVKASPLRIASNRLLYFALGMMAIFALLVPITMIPTGFLWPQVILLATLALILRNPAYVPFWLVGIVFLLGDFLLARPLGLGLFVAICATEFLRRNRPAFVEMLFLSEWFGISMLMLGTQVLSGFMLTITLAERMPWSAFFWQFVLNTIAYPVIVILVQFVFRVSKSEETLSYAVKPTI